MILIGEPFNFCAILDDYQVDKLLGEGGFGKVNLAIHRQTGKQVAIKFMDIADSRKCTARKHSIILTVRVGR